MPSILRCALNTDDVPDGLWSSVPGARHLWRVWVDSELIADTAMPFLLNDNIIELEAYQPGAIRGDGHRLISARCAGSFAIWMYPDTLWGRPGLGEGEAYTFRLDQYTAEVERCIHLDMPDADVGGTPSSLTSDDIRSILRHGLPEVDSLLYTQPPLPDDPRGARLAARLKHHLVDQPIEVDYVDQPEDVLDLAIGLDLDGNPEARWQLGRVGESIAICFLSYPTFGLWLRGPAVDVAVGDLAALLRE
jgi:hypothetical protein